MLVLATCFGFQQRQTIDLTRGNVDFRVRFSTGDASSDAMLGMMTSFAATQPDGGRAFIQLLDDMLAARTGQPGERGEIFNSLFGADSMFDANTELDSFIAQDLNPVDLFTFTNAANEINAALERGIALYNLGDLDGAQTQFDDVDRRVRQFQDSVLFNRMGRALLSMSRYFSGSIAAERGDYARAVVLLNEALALEAESGTPITSGFILINLGGMYFVQGNYAQSITTLNQAVDVMRATNNIGGLVQALSNLSGQYLNLGLNSEALRYANEALEIERSNPPDPQSLLNGTRSASVLPAVYLNRAQAEFQAGLYSEALTSYEQVRDIALIRIADASDNAITRGLREALAYAYAGIGSAHSALGNSTDAEQGYMRAVENVRPLNIADAHANILLLQASFYFISGQSSQTYAVAEQAYAIAQSVNSQVSMAQASWLMARTAPEGDDDRARQLFRRAADHAEAIIQSAGFDRASSSVLSAFSPIFQDLALTEAVEGNHDAGVRAIERGRAALIRAEQQGVSVGAGAETRELLALEQTLNLRVLAARTRIATLTTTVQTLEESDASAADITTARTSLREANAELIAAETAYQQHRDRLQGASYAAGTAGLRTASLAEIQAVLPDDTTLLIYNMSGTGTVYLITEQTAEIYNTLSPVEVDPLAAALRANPADVVAQRALYEAIFGRADELITTSRLMIVPDGVLNGVPFAALRAADERYLIDHYAISIIPSGTTLVMLNERQPAPPLMPGLALAYADAPGFPLLARAESEARNVAALTSAVALTSASESDLRAGVYGSGLLYIAAHGSFNRSAPLFSALYLRGDAEHDGALEVREIYELDLSAGTSLVILSACETDARGAGDEYAQMSRAFLTAGANTVVSTLWKVEEEATSALMLKFLEARQTHQDADALRIAMRYVRDDLGFTSPYYWAGITLTGLTTPPSPERANAALAVRPTATPIQSSISPDATTVSAPTVRTVNPRRLHTDQEVRVLACPSPECAVVEEVPPDSTVYMIGLTENNWLYVMTPFNRLGYIQSTVTTPAGE
jgi:CHAT domain-containing protein